VFYGPGLLAICARPSASGLQRALISILTQEVGLL
jgi:hypothetical protein